MTPSHTPTLRVEGPAYPALFVSHAAPAILLADKRIQSVFGKWAENQGRPRFIIVVSAHWDTPDIRIGIPENDDLFLGTWGGEHLRSESAQYVSATSAKLAEAHLEFRVTQSPLNRENLYHSVWLPLTLLYGFTGIPTIMVSIQSKKGTAHHTRIGEILRPLRAEGALVLGSGSLTHNHADIAPSMPQGLAKPWAESFCAWMRGRLLAGDRDSLNEYRRLAPFALISQPEEDHLLPLFVVCGAGNMSAGTVVHDDYHFGTISMAAFSFA